MQLYGDYHTHTVYSHGTGTILENAIAAREKGLKEFAVADHGFNHPAYGIKRRELDAMRRDCDEATLKTGVRTLLSCEANITGTDGSLDVRAEDAEKMDILIAGLHVFVVPVKMKDLFGFFGRNFMSYALRFPPSDKLREKTTKAYIRAIERNPLAVITHVNFRAYADCVEVAKCCRDNGTYFEINTKKTHLSDEDWLKVAQTGVRFVIDSDAHSPSRVGDTQSAEEMFARTGFPLELIDNIGGRSPSFRKTR